MSYLGKPVSSDGQNMAFAGLGWIPRQARNDGIHRILWLDQYNVPVEEEK